MYGSGGNDAANGIEADNDSSTPEATPISAPVLSNVTLVGNPEIDHSGWGMLLRRGRGHVDVRVHPPSPLAMVSEVTRNRSI